MAKKYYLDDEGLIKVLQNISTTIKQKTSTSIDVQDVEDIETGQTVKEVQNPKNFATVGAVYNYVQDQSKNLIINKQSAKTNLEEDGYEILENSSKYNGSEQAQINFKLVEYTDIQNLFLI